MILDEFRDEWRQDGAGLDQDDAEELMEHVRQRAEALERTIRRRDRLETGMAALVSLFFLSQFGSAGPVTRVGILVTVAAAILIAVRLHRARAGAGAIDRGAPIVLWARRERDWVAGQIRLLQSVLWWYVLPLMLGVILVFGGAMGPGLATALYSVGVAVFGAGVYWLNQQAVRLELLPRYRELDTLVHQFAEEG